MATEAFFKTPMMRMHLHILAALTVGIGAEQPIKIQNYYEIQVYRTSAALADNEFVPVSTVR